MTQYTYKRKDGGTTSCYGTICEDSNFSICCDNEFNDGIWTDNTSLTTWRKVCEYLESNYDTQIEQVEAC
jgi:hypothetical protein